MFGIRHGRKNKHNPIKALSRRWTPVIEALEDRTVPATLVWQGDIDGFWNSGTVGVNTNWADQATSAQVKPQNGDSLLFPLVASNFTNTNNIAGLSLNTITFGGVAYNVGGNAITLANLSDGSTAGANALNTPITVSGNLNVDVPVASTVLSLGGSISGAGGVIKSGQGTLRFNNIVGNSYTGTTTVNNGTLSLQVLGVLAVPGNLVIGDGVGAPNSAIVTNNFNDEIANTASVTVNSDGLLNGVFDTVGSLTVNAGGGVNMLLTVTGNATLLGTAGSDSVAVNSFAPFNAVFAGQTVSSITAANVIFDGAGGTDTLLGTAAGQVYNIAGANAGLVTGTNFSFTNVENVTGGAGSDIFILQAAGSLTGTMDGGGVANDTLQGPNLVNTWTLTGPGAGNINGTLFASMDDLGGGTSTDTLIAPNSGVTINVISANNGTIPGIINVFAGFENLTGGTGGDTFNIPAAGSISGVVNGGAGNDIFNVAPNAAVPMTIDGGGAAETNTVNFDLTGVTTPVYTPTGANSGVASFGNRASVTVSNIQNINTAGGQFLITLNGTAGNDVFTVSKVGNNIVVTLSTNNGPTTTVMSNVNAAAISTLVVNGLDGSDQLIVDHSTGIVNVPINYDGGPGSPDSLLVRGNFGGNFSQMIYIVTVPGAGSVNLDGNAINFSNLTPVTVTSLIGTTTINENSGAGHQLTLQDNPGAGLGSDVLFDGGLESLTFSNPTVALNVNAGDGNDTVTLFALDPAFAAPNININAGNDQDTVQILATKSGINTNVDTAGGTPLDRTIVGNVFPFNNGAGSLANILGPVNVTDSGGIGQLFVDDSSNPAQTVGNMNGTSINISGHVVNYTGNLLNDVEIALGLAPLGDTFLVNATSTVTTIFGNNGGEVIDIQGSGVVSTLTINGGNDNDSFNLLSPSPTGIININGGAPVFGDPTVPPGDKITVSFGGASSTGLPDGTLIIPGSQNVNYTSIETLLLPDRFEFNNTIGTATFLGSPPFLTLDRLNIHSVDNPVTPANEADIDYFRYTAHDTGWLVVNAFFTDDPVAVGDNLRLEIRDASDTVLASMDFNAVNGERMVIPVVGQRVYYIRVAGSNPILDANNYNLEIENFAAPVPSVVDLTAATDSGRSQTDNITNFNIPTFNIQADLSAVAAEFATTAAQSPQLAGRGLGILTPAQAQAGNVIGFAVQVFIDGVAAGFADVVPGSDNSMFLFTPTAPLADGIHQVTAAVRVFDVNTVPVQARAPLGSPALIVTIDTVAPLAPTLNLNPPDDTGLAGQPETFRDNITSNQAANFTGNSAPDAWVQLTAFDQFNTPLPDFGTGYANAFGQYFIDPTLNLNDPFFFTQDGERTFAATATDVAGNQSEASNLTIFLDTRGPQVIDVLANGNSILTPKASPGFSITSIDIFFIDQPARTDLFTYPAVNEILATTLGNYSLVGKKTGVHPIISIDYVDATVSGDIGQTAVRLNFGAALPDDQYTLKVFDRVADVAFNKLDGDFFGALPSGDGVPGGNFVTGTGGNGSINLDNTPELGYYANGSVNLDINGDFIVNPSPVAGQDVIVPYGPTGAAVFTGQFSDVGAGAVSGFDRLGTYGLEGKKYYFRLDFNDDGDFSDAGEKIPSGLQINGLPIAGNWNVDKAGDEVGLFTGTTWYLDTDGDNSITAADTKLVGKMRGLPIAGDFDGDGLDDLATYQNGTFSIDFADNGLTGNADISFKPRGFPGGANGVASKLARPVTADFDRDGIDDIGLFIPNQTNLTKYQANWYFLVSNDAFGFNRIPGTAITLDHPFKSNQFPSGSLDFSATYGSSKGLPVVGNFDPPVRAASTYRPADVANLAHNLADMYFASSIDPFTGKPKTWR